MRASVAEVSAVTHIGPLVIISATLVSLYEADCDLEREILKTVKLDLLA